MSKKETKAVQALKVIINSCLATISNDEKLIYTHMDVVIRDIYQTAKKGLR